MNKKKAWKFVTLLAVSVLLVSVAPEVRLLALVIELVGLDIILLMFEAQILVMAAVMYRRGIRPLLSMVNRLFERLDGYYFVPTKAMIRECPAIVFHAVPFIVGFHMVVLVGA